MEEDLAVHSGGKKRPLQISLHYVINKSAVAIWVKQMWNDILAKQCINQMPSLGIY